MKDLIGHIDGIPVHSVLAAYIAKSHDVYRLTLGELMPASERKTFPVEGLRRYAPGVMRALTGKIAFIDYILIPMQLPPPDNPNAPWTTWPTLQVFECQATGTEPGYQRCGHMRRLKRFAQEYAIILKKEAITMGASNDISIALNEELGYVESRKGYMVKYLKTNSLVEDQRMKLPIGAEPQGI